MDDNFKLSNLLKKYKIKNIDELNNFIHNIMVENNKLKKIIKNFEKLEIDNEQEFIDNKIISKFHIYINDDKPILKKTYNKELDEIVKNCNKNVKELLMK